MANPMFEQFNIDDNTSRVMQYYAANVMPFLSTKTKCNIHKMLLSINTTTSFDHWPIENVNFLMIAILFHDYTAYHPNHNLERICVSFGSRVYLILKQYIAFSTFKPVSQPDPIAMCLVKLTSQMNEQKY